MKRYKSGSQKRKNKEELEKQIQKLPKVDSYFISKQKQPEVHECMTDPSSYSANNVSVSSVSTLNETVVIEKQIAGNTNEIQNTEKEAQDFERPSTSTEIKPEKINFPKIYDIGCWNAFLNKEEIEILTKEGPEKYQHRTGPFLESKQLFQNNVRFCSVGLFQSTKANGEKYLREWLTYSPSTGRVYCFYC